MIIILENSKIASISISSGVKLRTDHFLETALVCELCSAVQFLNFLVMRWLQLYDSTSIRPCYIIRPFDDLHHDRIGLPVCGLLYRGINK